MKKIIIGIILGMILCSGIVYGVNLYKASDILYTTGDGVETNVNDALNSLYDLSKSSFISNIAKDSNGNDALVHYYGARISSVTKTFNMNKGKYVLFVFTTYNDIYSSTATGGDTTNNTIVSGGKITKINDYCYVVDVENDNTTISITIKSYGSNEDRRTIYGIYFYE